MPAPSAGIVAGTLLAAGSKADCCAAPVLRARPAAPSVLVDVTVCVRMAVAVMTVRVCVCVVVELPKGESAVVLDLSVELALDLPVDVVAEEVSGRVKVAKLTVVFSVESGSGDI